MRKYYKLNLKGSIYNLRYSDDFAQLNFIVSKPGIRYDVKAGLNDGKIAVKETKFDSWEALRSLHKMRNPTPKEQDERHQPALAFIWSLSIDTISVGLILICPGGWYLWFQADKKRFYYGLISFSFGSILCIYLLLF